MAVTEEGRNTGCCKELVFSVLHPLPFLLWVEISSETEGTIRTERWHRNFLNWIFKIKALVKHVEQVLRFRFYESNFMINEYK